MGKRPKLSDFECGKITELLNQKLSQYALVEWINWSQTVVKILLHDQESYGTKNRNGKPRNIFHHGEKVVIKTLQQIPDQSMTRLKTETEVQIHKETSRWTIKKSGFRQKKFAASNFKNDP